MDHCRSEPDTPEAFSQQTARIQTLSTMRKLLGSVWLEAMGDTQFNSFQTGFLRKTDASHGVFVLERASEMAKEWKTPLFLAQLDLKKAFDHVQHSFATTELQQKGLYQSSCSRYSTNGGLRATLKSAWQASPVTNASPSRGVSRKEPQSRLQYLWLFLIMSWGTGTLDGETGTSGLTSIAYADDNCLLASNKKDLEIMVKGCIECFLAAGLETGLDKTFWTSTTRTLDASLNVDGHMLPWAETIAHVGANIHFCSNSGSAMTNRLQKSHRCI